jgi:hypothetical protein
MNHKTVSWTYRISTPFATFSISEEVDRRERIANLFFPTDLCLQFCVAEQNDDVKFNLIIVRLINRRFLGTERSG